MTKTGVKLLDFGLAKWESATGAAALTIEGTIAGTPEYMAPEQARGDKVDSRADIFAFGCVFYEMLTGKRAFEGPTSRGCPRRWTAYCSDAWRKIRKSAGNRYGI